MTLSTDSSTPVDNVAFLLRELTRLKDDNARLRRRVTDSRKSRDYWKRVAKTGERKPMESDDPRHGTDNGYSNLGCRCRRCRDAHNAKCLAYQHTTGRHKPWEKYVAERKAEAEARDNHGTEGRYVNGKCRCDSCRKASREARRRRRERVAA